MSLTEGNDSDKNSPQPGNSPSNEEEPTDRTPAGPPTSPSGEEEVDKANQREEMKPGVGLPTPATLATAGAVPGPAPGPGPGPVQDARDAYTPEEDHIRLLEQELKLLEQQVEGLGNPNDNFKEKLILIHKARHTLHTNNTNNIPSKIKQEMLTNKEKENDIKQAKIKIEQNELDKNRKDRIIQNKKDETIQNKKDKDSQEMKTFKKEHIKTENLGDKKKTTDGKKRSWVKMTDDIMQAFDKIPKQVNSRDHRTFLEVAIQQVVKQATASPSSSASGAQPGNHPHTHSRNPQSTRVNSPKQIGGIQKGRNFKIAQVGVTPPSFLLPPTPPSVLIQRELQPTMVHTVRRQAKTSTNTTASQKRLKPTTPSTSPYNTYNRRNIMPSTELYKISTYNRYSALDMHTPFKDSNDRNNNTGNNDNNKARQHTNISSIHNNSICYRSTATKEEQHEPVMRIDSDSDEQTLAQLGSFTLQELRRLSNNSRSRKYRATHKDKISEKAQRKALKLRIMNDKT